MTADRLLRWAWAPLALFAAPAAAAPPALPPGYTFPSVAPSHPHARALLANCLRYADPKNKPTDPASGYPYEGWNADAKNGVFLRSFTQLTAIGLWAELLANVAAGKADSPHMTRDAALEKLAHLVRTLRQDQDDPELGALGLLGNFLDLEAGTRRGPLASVAEKYSFFNTFGPEKGADVWAALIAKGWLTPAGTDGKEAVIQRGPGYGHNHFDGPLAPFKDAGTVNRVMAYLDRRAVMIVFGDNANLTASVARTVGALLHPDVKDKPGVADVRRELERFLDEQQPGYSRLYDAKAGLFYFGWDAGRDRLFGWQDLQGKWVTGKSDYLVNEFRGPTAFVATRFNLPAGGYANLGFKMKNYRTAAGGSFFVLAPWEGSAFQSLGLSVAPGEAANPAWVRLNRHAVEVQTDFSTRRKLPGFLSESYTGNGTQYTGDVGIAEIAVSPRPRITAAPSLYAVGPAYAIDPERVERFLADHWERIASLFTDHGPWEGFNVATGQPIRFQTTAHTLSLALGLLGTGPEEMSRYLESRNLAAKHAALYPVGPPADLLAGDLKAFGWAAKGEDVVTTRDGPAVAVRAAKASRLGVAFVLPGETGANLSGGTLVVRYRATGPEEPLVLALKPAKPAPDDSGRIPVEIFARLADTGGADAELRVDLPATPGLTEVKEVVFSQEYPPGGRPVEFTVKALDFVPAGGK